MAFNLEEKALEIRHGTLFTFFVLWRWEERHPFDFWSDLVLQSEVGQFDEAGFVKDFDGVLGFLQSNGQTVQVFAA